MSENLFLTGNFAPVDDETTTTDLRVEGQLPPELDGQYLRIGPNPIDADPATYHWFLGNGMVHGVTLRDGRATAYRSRYVRDDDYVAARGLPPVQDDRPDREIYFGGIANTNVIRHAGKTYAIVEAGNPPVELDENLETVKRSDLGGTLAGGLSAHPKRDPDTGELFAAAYRQDLQAIQMVVIARDGRVRRCVDVPVPGKPMVHDCSITENYFVLLDLPVVLQEPEGESEASGLSYAWDESYGARVGLMPREGQAADVRWFDVDPCFVFHPLNSYEDQDGRVVLDVVRHPNQFAPAELGGGVPTLDRWIIDPKGGPVKEARLSDYPQEFPRHDERRLGKPYRYGYSTGIGEAFRWDTLLKHDLHGGELRKHAGPESRLYMEPVFVPRHVDAAEDEGWILAYTYEEASNSGGVVVLDAQDFEAPPLATVHLPVRVPFGFHGNWVPRGS